MIHYVRNGDIFESQAQTIVNPVNCVGVMGAGLALGFKNKYPQMFSVYQKHCFSGDLTPGKLMLYKTDKHWILNFPTKDHWINPSQMSYIEKGLEKFVSAYKTKGIISVAFPKLGCGRGGLDWVQVKALMEKYLNNLEIEVFIYV